MVAPCAWYIVSVHINFIHEVNDMKPMIWHPEEKDKKVNEYLNKTNRAPYFGIILAVIGLFSVFTTAVLLGVF
jgi:flagellar motor component MotA